MIPDDLKAESAEVYYSTQDIGTVDRDAIEFLKTRARETSRKRCRLCLHPAPQATQQEMVIVMHRDSYVPPHAHSGKGETLLVLEGQAIAPIFSTCGKMTNAISLGPVESGRTFLYRMPEKKFHGLWIETEWLVYVETTIGPFRADATVIPDWAPKADCPDKIADLRNAQLRVASQFTN